MPVYNGARHLGIAIESLLAQTLRDFELIVLDDGSSDQSLAIARAYASADQRVRVVELLHGGISVALNEGFRLARAPLVAHLDHDDVAWPERLERQVAYLDRNPDVGIVGAQTRLIDTDGNVVGALTNPCRPDEMLAASLVGCPLTHSSVVMRKDLVVRLGGYRQAFVYAEDYDLWLRAVEHTKLANLPETLVDYRVHEGCASVRFGRVQAINAIAARGAALARRVTGIDPCAALTSIDLTTLRAISLPPEVRAEWLALAFFALSTRGIVVDSELAWIDREAHQHYRADRTGRAKTALIRGHFQRARNAFTDGRYVLALKETRHAFRIDSRHALERAVRFAGTQVAHPR